MVSGSTKRRLSIFATCQAPTSVVVLGISMVNRSDSLHGSRQGGKVVLQALAARVVVREEPLRGTAKHLAILAEALAAWLQAGRRN